jgi:hypothetical protein
MHFAWTMLACIDIEQHDKSFKVELPGMVKSGLSGMFQLALPHCR